MSPIDPTGGENMGESGGEQMLAESIGGQMSYEEVSSLSNGELGIAEPTQRSDFAQEMGTAPEAPVTPKPPGLPFPRPPLPPLPVIKKAVSGRYTGALGSFQVELRIDVDRAGSTKRISGDFYQTLGRTQSYFGSFIVDAPVVNIMPGEVAARGKARFTFSAGAPVVQVTIPRTSIVQPQAPATLQFFTVANGPGASYHCAFESVYFRAVRIETDRASDVSTPIFTAYDTGSLPSGGTPRKLTVVSAYAEAGIAMVPTAGSDSIDIKEAGIDALWSNAELHAAMEQHFTAWKDLPQWCVWQLAAQNHELGSGLYGIMFDQQGKQRQGCAVFHAGIGGTTAEKLRLQAYTYVHELGHCFNLLHSWQKSLGAPPVPNRPDALSWMNYPWHYPKGGDSGFWNAFDFRFDNEELIHLRHGFRNDVIMGGQPFATGSALGRDVMADPIEDESGLLLCLSTHKNSFALGEPVVIEMGLRATDTRGRRAHSWLHPNCGLVHIVISKPSGEVVAFEPLIDHLVGDRQTTLGNADEIRESAYIGFGKGGFYFGQPGHYRIRAAYAALDGSQILSDILTVRVRYPVNQADEELADLMMGEEQGTLLYLMGSDNESLRRGNEAFDLILDKFGDHPLAAYPRMAKGINAGRKFKTIVAEEGKRIRVREPNTGESLQLLSEAAEAGVLDPVSTRMVLYDLSCVQRDAGDEAAAKNTLLQRAAMGIRQV